MSLAEQTLGEIACNIPGATRIFQQFRMDFCCGGGRSLKDEASRRKVDLPSVIRLLEQLRSDPSADRDWKKATPEELITYILERFHVRHREQLPDLIRLSEKVERVHADSPGVPIGLSAHLAEMLQELESHMQKEEGVLFPMLMRGQGQLAGGPISVMESEHVKHGEAIEKMLLLAYQLVLPEGACNSWRALYLGIGELRDDLMEHIHLENNILFKQAGNSVGNVCCGKCTCR